MRKTLKSKPCVNERDNVGITVKITLGFFFPSVFSENSTRLFEIFLARSKV